jgi:tape measure domain-containing protein
MANDSKTLELQIRIAAQEAVRAVSSLKGEIQTLASEAKKFAGTDGAALEKSFKDAESAAKDSVTSIGDIKKTVMSLAEVVAAAKALSVIKDMGVFALQTADNFQIMKNQFGILLGDMEAGAGLFNEIKAFNDVTPFDMDTLTQATNVLIAAKVPLQDLQSELTKFGDLSQGNSQRLTSYIHAYSIAAAKGKADTQVLNTYLNQGVPILGALAKQFKVTEAEVLSMASNGEIAFTDFNKALEELTAQGGMYFGGMELASKSLAAMQEGLKEAVNSLAASFGDMLLPAAVAIVGALTEITNAINESPILKGLFAGALVAVTGYLSAMAVKAAIAFAKQMALNLSIGALNPAVMAATIAVGVLAAGYVAVTVQAQNAKRGQEEFALSLRNATRAVDDWKSALRGMSGEERAASFKEAAEEVAKYSAAIEEARIEIGKLQADKDHYDVTPYIKEQEERIERFEQLLAATRENVHNAITATDELKTELPPLNVDKSAANAAAEFRKRWAEEWRRFQNQDNPFIDIEIAWDEKKADAVKNGAADLIGQINEYYQSQWDETSRQIKEQEKQLVISLTEWKEAALDSQMEAELDQLRKLEAARIASAKDNGGELLEIAETFAALEARIRDKYDKEKDKARLEDARAAMVDWQESLSDNLALALMKLEMFGDAASVVLADLSAEFANLGIATSMTGIDEFAKALGKGSDAGDAMKDAVFAMSMAILDALPNMFLQAGLQLIATPGMWPMGLALIAAAGATQFTKGYVEGYVEKEQAKANAHGGAYDEYGEAARAFAAGGAFTNQIVTTPTYFAHGGGLGIMGEAGPEAIMPLTRMPNGDLGIQTAGSGANVIVNIINNSGAEVQQEETENADGTKQIDVIIGGLVNSHIASGKADRVMAGRYGLRAGGV